MSELHAALILLAGCPDGATSHALMIHGIRPDVVSELVKNNAIVGYKERQSRIDLVVTRYRITEKGRSLLHEDPTQV